MNRSTFASTRIRPLALAFVCATLLLLDLAPPATGQAATESTSDRIPIEQDPHDPAIAGDHQEQIRRMREYIRRRQDERREEERQERLRKAREASQAARKKAEAETGSPEQTKEPEPKESEAEKRLRMRSRYPFVSFYLSPPSLVVRKGMTFATECELSNPELLPMDEVLVHLDYPANVVRPLAVHQDKIKPLLAGPAEVEVDYDRGRLSYVGQLAEPNAGTDLALITIVWEAIAEVHSAQIRPSFGGDGSGELMRSGASWRGTLVTRGPTNYQEAATGTELRVEGLRERIPKGLHVLGSTLQDIQPLLGGAADQSKLSSPRLWIDQPAEGMLQEGQWVVIDLNVSNPDAMLFDEVRLAGTFDPAAVELVDSDARNFIKQGVNILDGPFQDMYPWDMHFANRIEQDAGVFYYHMAMQAPREQPDGTLARIFLRIKKPVEAPLIEWIWSPYDHPDKPATGIFLYGQNLFNRHLPPPQHAEMTPGVVPPNPVEPWEKADPAYYRF